MTVTLTVLRDHALAERRWLRVVGPALLFAPATYLPIWLMVLEPAYR